jgi:hypothetical protein
MKTYHPFVLRNMCLALLAGLTLGQSAEAQGSGNQATRALDTALISDGFGIFRVQFPQSNPDSGTLVSVHISALTNTMYGFTLRDADSVSATYALSAGIEDEFSGPSLPAMYSNVTSQSLGSFPLTPGAGVIQAPMSLLQNNTSTDTVTAVTAFLGTGQVSLRYQSFTFTNLNSANNAPYFYSAGIANTITFSVKYLYSKPAGILPVDLTAWSAVPMGPRTVELSWAAADETPGRQYVIQRGTDNIKFQDIASVPATADGSAAQYQYQDELPPTGDSAANSCWYYRLEIQGATGSVTYSPIREVKLDGPSAGVQVYPNPAADFINFVPDMADVTDWQVDILSVAGALIQRNVFMQSRIMTVNFQNRLAAGTYFIHATDLRGQRSISTTFLVAGSR